MNIELIINKTLSWVDKYSLDTTSYFTAAIVYLNWGSEVLHSAFTIFTAIGSYIALRWIKKVFKKIDKNKE